VARIKDSSVEAVKAAVDIVAVVEGRTRLRKQGASLKGLCPFHQEKTPSFSVMPDRGIYHCFGCGEGGDAIDFVEKTEGVDFVGAIEWLADRFNVPLEYEEANPEADRERRRKERLVSLLDRAAGFYERYLWDTEQGAFAREYLASRGLTENVCREFRIGLAPGGGTLTRRALAEGFTQEELLAAGLANRRGNDYFQRRLLFPLADARGRIRGFQARQLHDDDPLRAKYVNSPEGALFRKGDLLYGLHQARPAIAKEDRAVVVEGNTDVLALRHAGFEPVVASMGTALTERQLKELGRLTKRLYLCFDADAAGQEATLRGMELAAAQGFDIHVVSLPPGSDPADDPMGFEERLRGAEDYLPYRVRLEIERARDRQEAFQRVQAFLVRFEDSPERQDAVRLAADRLDLPRETQAGLAPGASRATGTISPKLLDAGTRLERSALAGVAAHPELARLLAELGPEHFDRDEHRHMRAHLLGDVPPDDALSRLTAELHARAEAESIDKETAEQLLLRVRERRLQRELAEADDERLLDLQQALAQIRTAIRAFA
jgi:DNA primase